MASAAINNGFCTSHNDLDLRTCDQNIYVYIPVPLFHQAEYVLLRNKQNY